ncbi:hypothetical protein SALBM135S_09455 [Streptomyces alboniger]
MTAEAEQTRQVEGYRFSFRQQRLWELAELGVPSWAQVLVTLDGELDTDRLTAALHDTVARHEILRSVHRPVPGARTALLVVHDADRPGPCWSHEDPGHLDETARPHRIDEEARARRELPHGPAGRPGAAGGPLRPRLPQARAAAHHHRPGGRRPGAAAARRRAGRAVRGHTAHRRGASVQPVRRVATPGIRRGAAAPGPRRRRPTAAPAPAPVPAPTARRRPTGSPYRHSAPAGGRHGCRPRLRAAAPRASGGRAARLLADAAGQGRRTARRHRRRAARRPGVRGDGHRHRPLRAVGRGHRAGRPRSGPRRPRRPRGTRPVRRRGGPAGRTLLRCRGAGGARHRLRVYGRPGTAARRRCHLHRGLGRRRDRAPCPAADLRPGREGGAYDLALRRPSVRRRLCPGARGPVRGTARRGAGRARHARARGASPSRASGPPPGARSGPVPARARRTAGPTHPGRPRCHRRNRSADLP